MTFQDSIRTVLSKYATFTGRAGRPEYWWWVLGVLIAAGVASLLDGMIFGSDTAIFGGLLSLAIFVWTAAQMGPTGYLEKMRGG